MKHITGVLLFGWMVFVFSSCLNDPDSTEDIKAKEAVWEKIEPFFSAPAEYKEEYGNYRSLLKFYDGGSL